ncbi:unnamed protein product [Phyllotreta striolata]|uniref:Uncharacterized protein n=1 Tax=Phyllotreta striolata TaxID=444603 RepID=A0A9N9XK46_PHYSR|nr:unnamed protein product [Phyllotreta striolata]
MRPKSGRTENHSEKLAELNKKILEVKKKIQLSEGQRKALFEECEAERKSNADEILKLKKETSELAVTLHEVTGTETKYIVKNKPIEAGAWANLMDKRPEEVLKMIDLQIIDKSKQIDLLRYRTKQRRKYLAELAVKYQKLLLKHDKNEAQEKIDEPVKKSTTRLQNHIHAVNVQIREALHVKQKYTDIRKTLKSDADNFEGNIAKMEETLDKQRVDIEKLQTVMNEASQMKNAARSVLLKEERSANEAAQTREQELIEGRRLVNERKAELEMLEKKIFQGGKLPIRPEPEGAEEAPEEEKCPTPPHPFEVISQAFEVLKKATGGTSTEEVFERFTTQKEAEEKLMHLRTKAEGEKKLLEKRLENLHKKLDSFRYAEAKDAERKTGEMDQLQIEIDRHAEESRKSVDRRTKTDEAVESLSANLRNLYLCINPLAVPDSEALDVVEKIKFDVVEIFRKIGSEAELKRGDTNVDKEDVVDPSDEKWLPAPYAGLVRRTPLPQTGSPAPPPPPGSDDEEEVPSRGYLKRQAQLVVDAKYRRKNVRLQVARRN